MDPTEKLTIETPEQIELEFPLAGIGSRGLALCVDTLIQLLTALVVVLILMLTVPGLDQTWKSARNWELAIAGFLFFCLYWGYFAAFEIFWNGQTPGKRQSNIRVISASGRPITPFEGIGRNVMRAIDSLGLYAVGGIICAIDRKNRRLGDMVAGTVVVHEIEEASVSYWYEQGSQTATTSASFPASVLTPQEFQLIETFLSRRLDIPNLQRLQSGQMIADRIGDRLKVAKVDRPVDEAFLEEVSRQYRDTAGR